MLDWGDRGLDMFQAPKFESFERESDAFQLAPQVALVMAKRGQDGSARVGKRSLLAGCFLRVLKKQANFPGKVG